MKLYINILQDTRGNGGYDTGGCFTRLEEAYDHILKIESSASPFYRRCRYRGTVIVNGVRLRFINLRWDALAHGEKSFSSGRGRRSILRLR